MEKESKKPRVIVLLSTYNGEKYLEEQLDSIFHQTYSNLEIIVRDDGSIDHTVNILQKYKNSGKITYIKGENIGFIESFFDLLKKAPLADYYAFCDQDDMWEKEKIEKAVMQLQKEKYIDIPIMYYSNYDLYTEDMKWMAHPKIRNKSSFSNSLVECVNLGMTTVINGQTRKRIIEKENPNHSLGHDWSIYMICSAFGRVIYDDQVQVKHRVHSLNTSLCGESFAKRLIRRISTFRRNDHFQKLQKQIQEFQTMYGHELEKAKKEWIMLFCKPFTLSKQFKKLTYPKRLMNKWDEEIILRIAFLFGMI